MSIFIPLSTCIQSSECYNMDLFYNVSEWVGLVNFTILDCNSKVVNWKLFKLWPNRVWLLSLMLSIYQLPSVTLFIFKGFMHFKTHGTQPSKHNKKIMANQFRNYVLSWSCNNAPDKNCNEHNVNQRHLH